MIRTSGFFRASTERRTMVSSRILEPGAYPGATLRYACFRLDREKTPLNGAETKLTLWVQ